MIRLCILFALFALSQSTETAYTTCLPKISSDLNASPSEVQSGSSIYFYGFATGIFCFGGISDIIGRRPVILIGLSIFVIANIFIYFTDNITILLILRYIQAFGASVGSVGAQTMARDLYSGPQLSKLYASFAAGLAIMPSISSFIAGNILEQFGWRIVFIYLVCIFSILLIMCILYLAETLDLKNTKKRADYKGVFLTMLFDKKILCFGFMIGIFNGIMYGLYIEAPFIFMHHLSISPADYGSIILMQGISAAFGSIICLQLQALGVKGAILKRQGIIISIISCSSFVITALLWDNHLISNIDAACSIITCMMMQSFSYAIVMPLVLRYALEDYTKTNGTGGSIFGTYYYSIIATINVITTYLHDTNILKVSLFFLIGSMIALVLDYIAGRTHSLSRGVA